MGQFLQDGKNDQTLSKKNILVLAQFFDQAIFTDFTPKLWFLAIFEVDIMPSWN